MKKDTEKKCSYSLGSSIRLSTEMLQFMQPKQTTTYDIVNRIRPVQNQNAWHASAK